MKINLNIIYEKLKSYSVEMIMPINNTCSIKNAKLLEENQRNFEPDTVYIGNSSGFIGSLPQDGYINLILIMDESFSTKYLESSNINVIAINKNISVIKIFNKVQDIIARHLHYTFSSTKLLKVFLDNNGIQSIIDIGCEILENPVDLIDPSLRLIANSKKIKVEDLVWEELDKNGYLSNDSVCNLRAKRVIEKVDRENPNEPVFLGKNIFPIPRYIKSIIIDHKIVGHLAVMEYQREFNECDVELIVLLSNVIAEQMKKQQSMKNNTGIMEEQLFIDLMEGNLNHTELIRERIKYLNISLSNYIYVLTVVINENERKNISFQHLKNQFDRILPYSRTLIYSENIVVIINRNKSGPLNRNELEPLIEFLKKNNLQGGLSYSFDDIMNLNKYYKQALSAFEIGIHQKEEDSLYLYEDYVMYHAAYLCSKHCDLKTFCHPSIILLQEFDKKNNTQLLKTVKVYIQNMNNREVAAKTLGIHSNTLDYRLSKIKELININWKDGELMFQFYFSLKIITVLERYR